MRVDGGSSVIGALPASAAANAPRSRFPIRRTFHVFWYGRSVRVQLLLIFVLIDLIAVLVGGGATIQRARVQAGVETQASVRLAELLVHDAIGFLHDKFPAERFMVTLPRQLHPIRHVRIAVFDAAGLPIARGREGAGGADGADAPAPAWFTALIAPRIETRAVPVIVDGRTLGRVDIIGEPADEIAEVWEDVSAFGAVAGLLNLAMIALLYVLFGRVLDPLHVLAGGLSDLERRDYEVRLPRPPTRELAAIAERFNALARGLKAIGAENVRLNRRLITAQDDERRRTALELHDEVGPCLFGLKANASSIAAAAAGLSDQARRSVTERLRDILGIIEHLQAINRTMLDRLRPMALGHVPLRELLDQLIRERARQYAETAFSFTAGELWRSYGDSIDLTLYRCVQESLTNAIRHGRANKVVVDLNHLMREARLALTVRDDGCGMAAGATVGFGIRGMEERVRGLGGSLSVDSDDCGVCIRIIIPLLDEAVAADAAARGEAA
jgi:two-component system, NarL family, sensor histidine kinase UhpB